MCLKFSATGQVFPQLASLKVETGCAHGWDLSTDKFSLGCKHRGSCNGIPFLTNTRNRGLHLWKAKSHTKSLSYAPQAVT